MVGGRGGDSDRGEGWGVEVWRGIGWACSTMLVFDVAYWVIISIKWIIFLIPTNSY